MNDEGFPMIPYNLSKDFMSAKCKTVSTIPQPIDQNVDELGMNLQSIRKLDTIQKG